ncbi:hypothetical protein [Rhodosalinus sediminis]|uniref:hypothetical protein n=1 Tax=Rhodosalinus sediminis TaxID=1940533 RepID=UPI0023527540|nr:hypothetical protein [Rhodosalinus sediminis]
MHDVIDQIPDWAALPDCDLDYALHHTERAAEDAAEIGNADGSAELAAQASALRMELARRRQIRLAQ